MTSCEKCNRGAPHLHGCSECESLCRQKRELELQLNEAQAMYKLLADQANENDLKRMNAERLNSELAEALLHMKECGPCAEDSWLSCEGGRAALAALEKHSPEKQECEPCGNPGKACEKHGKPVGFSWICGLGFCGVCLAVMPCKEHSTEKRIGSLPYPKPISDDDARGTIVGRKCTCGCHTGGLGSNTACGCCYYPG